MTGKCGKLRTGVVVLPGKSTQISSDSGTMVSLENKIQVPLYNSTEHIIFWSIYAYTMYINAIAIKQKEAINLKETGASHIS